MNDETAAVSPPAAPKRRSMAVPWIAVGAAIGTGVGVATGAIAVGVGVGVALGAAMQALRWARER